MELLSGKLKINKEFESNTSSASPTLAGNLLFVPISTYETVLAIDPNYECCKSSGGMIAINSENGEIIWNHRIEERAKFTKKGLITRTKNTHQLVLQFGILRVLITGRKGFLELAKVYNPLHLRTAIPLFL